MAGRIQGSSGSTPLPDKVSNGKPKAVKGEKNNQSIQNMDSVKPQLNKNSPDTSGKTLQNRKIRKYEVTHGLHENNLQQILYLAKNGSYLGFASSLEHYIDKKEQLEQIINQLPSSVISSPAIQESITQRYSQIVASNTAEILTDGLS
ncbi:hypothetical protein ACH42_05070 [Endozoicomonas sp. (ex Bugula neritina AB1)]|nr:hypothetical protein ACH42_05070 [Endozoicomonas sp. (ex Bugula neritina AB1)]